MPKIIAIDFDGCLCEDVFPDIGQPIQSTFDRYFAEREKGSKFILWTCREGASLMEALVWCIRYGIEFDAVNGNLLERMKVYGTNPRKIGADEYWDDKAVRVGDGA